MRAVFVVRFALKGKTIKIIKTSKKKRCLMFLPFFIVFLLSAKRTNSYSHDYKNNYEHLLRTYHNKELE